MNTYPHTLTLNTSDVSWMRINYPNSHSVLSLALTNDRVLLKIIVKINFIDDVNLHYFLSNGLILSNFFKFVNQHPIFNNNRETDLVRVMKIFGINFQFVCPFILKTFTEEKLTQIGFSFVKINKQDFFVVNLIEKEILIHFKINKKFVETFKPAFELFFS